MRGQVIFSRIRNQTFLIIHRQALIIKRYRRSPSPKGEVMSSRPRDMHTMHCLPPGAGAGPRLSPEAAALIPREPEAKVQNKVAC